MVVELRALEDRARVRRLVRDADDQLRCNGDRCRITANLTRVPLELRLAGSDALQRKRRRKPTLTKLRSTTNRTVGIAGRIDRQPLLQRLRIHLDVTEANVVALIGRVPLLQQNTERLKTLAHQLRPLHTRQIRKTRLKLLAIRPDPRTGNHPPVAEPVKRRKLLREHDRMPHRHHNDPRHQPQNRRLRRAIRIRNQRIEEIRRIRKRLPHIPLRREVIVPGHLVIAKLLRLNRNPNNVVLRRKRNRIHHPGGARWKSDAEPHTLPPVGTALTDDHIAATDSATSYTERPSAATGWTISSSTSGRISRRRWVTS